ncbi:uncharacterized protein [Channa argus]|uniref:uncharacterized protein n=1 Tax=Channa argus TaxID=215402 RepID=UPI002947C470|nr:hypothetical protein Q8A73_012572 [Channa argus]
MLHPLIYLAALTLLAGAAADQMITVSSEVDISSCPITFYGHKYEQFYVNFTSDNFIICFSGFYNPETRGDCIVGPKGLAHYTLLDIKPPDPFFERYFLQFLPTIKNHLQCMVVLNVDHNGTFTDFFLGNFGTQTALYLSTFIPDSVVIDAFVDGNAVDRWSFRGYIFIDISGCRYSGVLYKPGTAVKSPGTCFSITCSENAVLMITGSNGLSMLL